MVVGFPASNVVSTTQIPSLSIRKYPGHTGRKTGKREKKWYAGLNENGLHRLSVSGTFRRGGIVGVLMALLEEVCHRGGGGL